MYQICTLTQLSCLPQVIKARVKEMMIPRFRVICLVHIGQLGSQGLRVGSRCLWDDKYDTFSSSEFRNKSIFAIGMVYGVYYEQLLVLICCSFSPNHVNICNVYITFLQLHVGQINLWSIECFVKSVSAFTLLLKYLLAKLHKCFTYYACNMFIHDPMFFHVLCYWPKVSSVIY